MILYQLRPIPGAIAYSPWQSLPSASIPICPTTYLAFARRCATSALEAIPKYLRGHFHVPAHTFEPTGRAVRRAHPRGCEEPSLTSASTFRRFSPAA
ncbi:hypothetical protein KM043_004490 [Ampulex compressa]|nr:hypothetical protein KM043_004490 [Ampulex compressa]